MALTQSAPLAVFPPLQHANQDQAWQSQFSWRFGGFCSSGLVSAEVVAHIGGSAVYDLSSSVVIVDAEKKRSVRTGWRRVLEATAR